MRHSIRQGLVLLLFALPLSGEKITLDTVWPTKPVPGLTQLGAGVGLIFSPDLSVPGNCDFYRALGFACFDSPDWSAVIEAIRSANLANPGEPIRTLIIESHGTNGNGLKLQNGKLPEDQRSYVSVGGLQERLDRSGVQTVVVSACNSRRLFRSHIYNVLDPLNGDPLFLPATLGILNAEETFNQRESEIRVVTREESQLETTIVGMTRELDEKVQRLIVRESARRGVPAPTEFSVSEMLVQLLTRDRGLKLVGTRAVDKLSKTKSDPVRNELVFKQFAGLLAEAAQRRRLTDGL